MRHHTATFSAALLSPAARERFLALFTVAERKSIFGWQEASLVRAELVILDGEQNSLPVVGAPCVVFVGASIAAATGKLKRCFQLTPDFTISQLLDVLDRSAVWLLELRTQAQMRLQETGDAGSPGYKLRRWVTLAGEFSGSGYTRAMALLTREPMTLEKLCSHSGLDNRECRKLLEQLARLDVVQTFQATTRSPRGTDPSDRQREGSGLLSKLSRWLRQGRSVPEGR
jgi:hypothetical protein